jgi:predicted nucleic acid-binding Zn finger protein
MSLAEKKITRQERAALEFSSYTFRLMTMKTSAGPRGLVYLTSGSGNTYTVTDHGRCNCPDFQRRQQPCKHLHATERWLAGDVPTEEGGL